MIRTHQHYYYQLTNCESHTSYIFSEYGIKQPRRKIALSNYYCKLINLRPYL